MIGSEGGGPGGIVRTYRQQKKNRAHKLYMGTILRGDLGVAAAKILT